MGFSANQARLLTLTGRRCDLEKQMQVILNNKLRIAEQTSKIANDYNESISNRKLFVFSPSTNEEQQVYLELNASNLYNKVYDGGGNFLVAVREGSQYRELEQDDIDSLGIEEGLRTGDYVIVKEATMQTQDPKAITFTDSSYAGGGVLGGGFSATEFEIVDWRSSTAIMDQLDESDDLVAQTKYESEMSDLNIKETKMDIEMNDVETEHRAVANEIESVKKIITKNNEDMFKYFS